MYCSVQEQMRMIRKEQDDAVRLDLIFELLAQRKQVG